MIPATISTPTTPSATRATMTKEDHESDDDEVIQKYAAAKHKSSRWKTLQLLFKVKTMNTPVGVYDILVYSHISDMAFVELVEEPLMNGWSLLGTLGGHFHLLLGMSLASFLELGQFILIAVSRSFSKYKRAGSTRILNPVRVQETLLKTGYIPSAVRSSNKLASILWTGMFLSSAGVCIFLIRQTALDFLSNRVTSSVSRRGDMSTTGSGSAIRTFF